MTSSDTRYEIRDTSGEGRQPRMVDRPLITDHRPPATVLPLRIAVVGPCASGKSTLVAALRAAGYEARHPAQEHSYVPDMWRRLVDPDVLIYLDLSHEAYRQRRPKDDAGPDYLAMQRERLAHARAHADLVVDTSGMTAEAVRAYVLAALA
ncbi:MAG: hypothetical protein R3C43_06990 [Chloroflexota bacterium]